MKKIVNNLRFNSKNQLVMEKSALCLKNKDL